MQVQSNNSQGTWKKGPLENGQLANKTWAFWNQGKTQKIWWFDRTWLTDRPNQFITKSKGEQGYWPA